MDARAQRIKRVLVITFFLNILVSGVKIFLGYSINSVAVVSDGFHSLYDGLSNVIGYIGVALSSAPPDEKHPYGHRKFETIFAISIGVLICLTCFEIFRKSIQSLADKKVPEITASVFGIIFMTLIINIFVNRYEVAMGKKLRSEFLLADAGHTASDIFITIGAMLGLLLCKLGVHGADAVTGLLVGFMVALVGYRIIKDSIDILVDTVQVDKEEIKTLVMGVEGVTGCHDIRTRGTKESVFLDLHAEVEKNISIEEAHEIADKIEEKIKQEMPNIKDVVVHMEPKDRNVTTKEDRF
ncbi:MAG: cation diffusion facilitator family transporter [Deltaproteobacteria bacterium]|nr:cation diffusion facilitator family transporter [Deltaproteobacteria bacterium]